MKLSHFPVIPLIVIIWYGNIALAGAARTGTLTDTRQSNLSATTSTGQQKSLSKKGNKKEGFYGLTFYKPNYLLPYYYTTKPLYATSHRTLRPAEFKMQISFQVPLIQNLLGSDKSSLNFAYTQDSFWQLYTDSPYFRETNYEPELFFRRTVSKNLNWKLGIVHQSNGLGGNSERGWNRFYGEAIFSGKHWMVSLKPWLLIIKNNGFKIHNSNIIDYMGNGRIRLAYKLGSNTLSFMTRNNMQSHFKRGAEELTFSFPIHGAWRGYIKAFSGYGHSLIEYDHYTNAFAVGLVLNDWL